MFNGIKTYLLFANRYIGIEHSVKDAHNTIRAVIVKVTKKEADVETAFEAETVKDLAAKLPRNSGSYLIINDANVITKKVETDRKDPVKIVNMAFPGLDVNDFVYDILIQDTTHFVSICRKDYMENILENYKANGMSIIGITLGSVQVSTISQFISDNTIYTGSSAIFKNEKEIVAIEESDTQEDTKTYNINGIQISGNYLLSLAAALAVLLQTKKSESNFESQKQQLYDTYSRSRLLKQSVSLGLIIIFALLLINFLVFSYYFDKAESLQQASQINKEAKTQILALEKKVSKSQKTVETMLNSGTSKTALYLNSIILGLPASIQLSEINYQPLTKRLKGHEPAVIIKNTIVISGNSGDSDLFADWITRLESEDWVEKVETLDYSDLPGNTSVFSIKISMHND